MFGTGKLAERCGDTDLLVPLAPASQARISSSLRAVTTGSKPDAAMASAVVAALRDLAATRGPHTLVVVTGGSDSCNAQAGQLIAAEAKKDGIDYQLFVVGFQVPDDQGAAVSGLVDSAGNGHYINAHSRDELTTVLTAIQQYVNDPNATTAAGVLATAAAAAPSAPSPTIPPAATQVPATATRVPATATPAFGLTACDNPYMPLRPGSTWTYSFDTGGSQTWTVDGVTGDASQAVAHLTIGGGANLLSGDWQCSGAGIAKFDFPVWLISAPGQKVGSTRGIWLPPAGQLVAGATWETHYTIEFDTGSGNDVVHYIQAITETYHYAGAEQVMVAGKTYDAIRVDGIRTADLSAPKQPKVTVVLTHVTDKLQIWLARGVGMVRFDSAYMEGVSVPGQNYAQQLESYTIP